MMGLKQRVGAVKLVPSSGGAFEVRLGGAKVHSKLETGRFPDQEAMLKAAKEKLCS